MDADRARRLQPTEGRRSCGSTQGKGGDEGRGTAAENGNIATKETTEQKHSKSHEQVSVDEVGIVSAKGFRPIRARLLGEIESGMSGITAHTEKFCRKITTRRDKTEPPPPTNLPAKQLALDSYSQPQVHQQIISSCHKTNSPYPRMPLVAMGIEGEAEAADAADVDVLGVLACLTTGAAVTVTATPSWMLMVASVPPNGAETHKTKTKTKTRGPAVGRMGGRAHLHARTSEPRTT